eukprot:gnl/Spiro4/16493_TR8875_c0_g1_i1.p1 gnl/Spiro4/16493_TR8875_c0_g1~~gnl/Spiro4/16493_TR8875_c0_g1_i1.p1  ORF type:complete len:278 (-),score=63.53 gnl/Spiro4/16493_TR8875_c0_g1_i1:127-960(-)
MGGRNSKQEASRKFMKDVRERSAAAAAEVKQSQKKQADRQKAVVPVTPAFFSRPATATSASGAARRQSSVRSSMQLSDSMNAPIVPYGPGWNVGPEIVHIDTPLERALGPQGKINLPPAGGAHQCPHPGCMYVGALAGQLRKHIRVVHEGGPPRRRKKPFTACLYDEEPGLLSRERLAEIAHELSARVGRAPPSPSGPLLGSSDQSAFMLSDEYLPGLLSVRTIFGVHDVVELTVVAGALDDHHGSLEAKLNRFFVMRSVPESQISVVERPVGPPSD